jgi:hypothetical protein
MKKHHIIIAIISFIASTLKAQSKLDIVAASPVYSINLEKLPKTRLMVYASVMPNIAQKLIDMESKARFEEQITNYLKELRNTPMNHAGVLIRVRGYVDQYGTNIFPTNFFTPIAAGLDPVDAYSEHINTPIIQVAPIETTAKEVNSYLWIEKIDTNLTIASIPDEFNEELIRQANIMAMKKVENKAYLDKPLPTSIPDYASRAQYWNNLLKEKEKELKTKNKLARAKELAEEFESLQKQHGRLVQEYEALTRRKQSNTSLLNTLQTALNIGSFFTSNPTTDSKVSYDPKIIQQQNVVIDQKITTVNVQINNKTSRINQVDEQIKSFLY